VYLKHKIYKYTAKNPLRLIRDKIKGYNVIWIPFDGIAEVPSP
jgi:hypothetical protein